MPEEPAMELNENEQSIRVNVFDWVHNNNFCGSEEIEGTFRRTTSISHCCY